MLVVPYFSYGKVLFPDETRKEGVFLMKFTVGAELPSGESYFPGDGTQGGISLRMKKRNFLRELVFVEVDLRDGLVCRRRL